MRSLMLTAIVALRTAAGIFCVLGLVALLLVCRFCCKRCPPGKMLVVYGKLERNKDGGDFAGTRAEKKTASSSP